MQFNYRYHSSSHVEGGGRSTDISFAPDTLRPPVFFHGKLSKHIPFREAISALHDVVISDQRYVPKDKTEYKEWAAKQELIDLDELISQNKILEEQNKQQIIQVQKELEPLNLERNQIMKPYYESEKKYFSYLYKRDYEAWFVLDPVITVHPDEVFFECFSKDESSYGRLSCGYEVFNEFGDFSCGTTNIDYSNDLYNEFQKIRDYKDTQFTIESGGFEVETQGEEAYNEVKIDLPESWVRGFLQVSSAMTLPTTSFELHPMDVYNLCFHLRRKREVFGPRSIRFCLKPGKPIAMILEPWNLKIDCARSIYQGSKEDEIRIWGRRRIHILERLIPVAKKFTVHLLGTGLPSFFIADLGGMNFTLGLSGWSINDWSKMGSFDLMAPRMEVDQATKSNVFGSLKENWVESLDSLSSRLNLDRAVVAGALSANTQAGRVIYDLNKQVYRVRELSREVLPMEKLRFADPREKLASHFITENNVKLNSIDVADGYSTLSGSVKDKNRTHTSKLVIDQDQRIVEGECSCNFYTQNKLYKGPCEHMIAVRLSSQ